MTDVPRCPIPPAVFPYCSDGAIGTAANAGGRAVGGRMVAEWWQVGLTIFHSMHARTVNSCDHALQNGSC